VNDSAETQQSAQPETADRGIAADLYAPLVAEMVNNLEIQHLLDYGCGKQLELAHALQGKVNHAFQYQAYDPNVLEFRSAPIPAQMVACINVLERIEDDHVDAVLDHLCDLTEEIGFFAVDGTSRPAEWWLPRIMSRFDLQTFQVTGSGQFYVIVRSVSRQSISEHGNESGDNRSN